MPKKQIRKRRSKRKALVSSLIVPLSLFLIGCIIIDIIMIFLIFRFVQPQSQGGKILFLLPLISLCLCLLGEYLLYSVYAPLGDLDKLVFKMDAELGQNSKTVFDDSQKYTARGNSNVAYENISILFEQHRLMREKENSNRLLAQQAQFTALQSQINPHFLYNTLESLRGDALVADAPQIAEIAEALSRFFRYSISQSGDLVPIAMELENIRNYFRIQQYRFGDRLEMEIIADSDNLDQYLLPKLILQPIVENSIFHGLDPKIGPGHISIRVTISQSTVVIVVRDDGVGMKYSTLEALRTKIARGDPEEEGKTRRHSGMAMRNVHQRIQLLFGEEYGLYLDSAYGVGTDVTLVMPTVTSRQNAEIKLRGRS